MAFYISPFLFDYNTTLSSNKKLFTHTNKILLVNLSIIDNKKPATRMSFLIPDIPRVNTSQGIRCRAVADKLPAYAQADEPSLEDAYLYLISREVAQ